MHWLLRPIIIIIHISVHNQHTHKKWYFAWMKWNHTISICVILHCDKKLILPAADKLWNVSMLVSPAERHDVPGVLYSRGFENSSIRRKFKRALDHQPPEQEAPHRNAQWRYIPSHHDLVHTEVEFNITALLVPDG